MPAPARGRRQPPHQYVGRGLKPLMKSGRRHEFERGEAGDHRHRIAGQRARLVDGAQGRELLHDVAPSAECADRHAAADDLAERGEIRAHAVERLRAAQGDAKAGHHLVEDQQCAGCGRIRGAGSARNPAPGGTQFMLPATGSTMTQATCAPICRNTSRT